ncbi:MAG: putative metal-binding motif-containing protein [Sandaracinus sp.]
MEVDAGTDACTPTPLHPDVDGDRHGEAGSATQMACAGQPGYAATSDDCDDTDPASYPGATEVCDGADNDCDGVVEEGLGFVGPAVEVGPGDLSPMILGLNDGFGVIHGVFAQPDARWHRISTGGGSTSAPIGLGAGTGDGSYATGFDGGRVVVLMALGERIFGFDPVTGNRTLALTDLPVPSGRSATGGVRLPRVTLGSVVAYEEFAPLTSFSDVRRWVIDTTDSTPAISDTDDLGLRIASRAWDVSAAGPSELVVFRSDGDHILLREVDPTGRGTGRGTVRAALAAPDTSEIAIHVHDPSRALSAENPLTIVIAGAPGQPLGVLQVTDLNAPAGGPSVLLPGSIGVPPARADYQDRNILVAEPAGANGMGAIYVVASEIADVSDLNHRVLRAWEIRSGSPPIVRALTLPADASLDGSVTSVATFGTTVRVAQRMANRTVVTRQLGCR